MSDAIRNVTIRVGLEYVNATPQINTEPAMKALKNLADEQKRVSDEAAKASREAEALQRRAAASTMQVYDSFKRAGEGAFTFARGIAFLTTRSDEDFKAMINNIAKVQGAFDLFKGTLDVLSGLRKAQLAYRAATDAAAAAQLRLTAATLTTTAAEKGQIVTTWGLVIAKKALALASNPIALGLAALAVAGVAAYSALTKSSRDFEEQQKREHEAMMEGIKIQEGRQRAYEEGSKINPAGQAARNSGLMNEAGLAAKLPGADPAELIARAQRQREAARSKGLEDLYDQDRSGHLGLRDEARNKGAQGITFEAIKEGKGGDADRLQAFERMEQSLKEQAGWVQKEVDFRGLSLDRMNKELAGMQEKVTLAQKALTEEQKRMEIAAEIGRLSKTDLAELTTLQTKIQQGAQLTAQELKRLEEIAPTLAGKFVDSQYAKKGEGAADVGGLLGTFQVDPTQAEAALQQAQRNVDDMKERIAKEAQTIEEANSKSWGELLQIFRETTDVSEEIAKLKQQLAYMEAARNAR